MNAAEQGFQIYCEQFIGFPLREFDRWLKTREGEALASFTKARQRAMAAFVNNADDETLKAHLEAIYFRWQALPILETSKPLREWQQNRLDSLRAEKDRHKLWRTLAEKIRESNPHLKSKKAIATIVRRQLVNSHNNDQRKAARSVETIRKQI